MPRFSDITPDRWSHRGEADGEVRGHRVRVWGGIPGERALVKIVAEGQQMDYATWQRADRPHWDRVEPRCRRYHACGGCPLMHVGPATQQLARREIVMEALHDEGLGDVHVGAVVPSPDGIDGFRWVAKLGIGYSDEGRIRVGAWGRNTRRVVTIPECNVVSDEVRRAMVTVAHFVVDMAVRPYDSERDEGLLRAIVLRGSRAHKEVHVTLVAGRRVRVLQELADEVVANNSEIVGVALHLNDDPGNAIYHRDEDGAVPFLPLAGRQYVDEELGGFSYRIGPGDFFQTNPAMAEVLYRQTLSELRLEEGVPFVDLYCGVGGFAVQAAQQTGWALGVEEVEGAARQAREAAKRNKVQAEFVAGEVVKVLPEIGARLHGSRPVMTVNPARRGLEDGVVEQIVALAPLRVAYISCNPKALARDLARFRAAGMQVGPVALYDMFPNTPHVEAVVILEGAPDDGANRRAPKRSVVAAPARRKKR
jgi:23S rRNA (uracil1939-C5)-methyltransferase